MRRGRRVHCWAARALKRAGDVKNSNFWLEQAAHHPHSFYGLMAAHLMGNVSGKIRTVAGLQHVASIGCPHFHRAGQDKEHLLPVVLLPSPFARWFGTHVEQKCFHHTALRRQQLEAVVAGVFN